MSNNAADEAYIAAYANFVRTNYMSVSSRVVFLWDYCVTFDEEVRFFWGGKLSPATILFMINRYVNLLITILELLEQAPLQTPQSCGPFIRVLQSLLIFALFIVAVFASLRVYAVWGRDWRPALPIFLLALVSPILSIIIDVGQTPAIAPPPSVGCAVYMKIPTAVFSKLIVANRATTSIYDALVLFLTVLRTVNLMKRAKQMNVRTGIVSLLLRDGAVYFFALLVINLAQIIITAEYEGSNLLSYYVSPLTSVLISRFLLHLRQAGDQDLQARGTERPSLYLTSHLPVYSTSDFSASPDRKSVV